MTGPNPWADPYRPGRPAPSIPQPNPGAFAPYGPAPAGPPTTEEPAPRRSKPVALIIALAVFVVAAGAATALWLVTRSELATEQAATADLEQQVADLERQSADLKAENADLAEANADFEADEADRAAAAADVPNLRQVADKHLANTVTIYGNADYLDITLTDTTVTAALPGLIAMLDELGFSPAVIDRMAATRALDGTLREDGRNCNVTWTYHPDNGLQMVFAAVHPS